MSERGSPRFRNRELVIQYEELIRLRVEVARLLNPLKNSSRRKYQAARRLRRQNR